jgi:hypothetical protein
VISWFQSLLSNPPPCADTTWDEFKNEGKEAREVKKKKKGMQMVGRYKSKQFTHGLKAPGCSERFRLVAPVRMVKKATLEPIKVKTWFQAFAFTFDLHRYAMTPEEALAIQTRMFAEAKARYESGDASGPGGGGPPPGRGALGGAGPGVVPIGGAIGRAGPGVAATGGGAMAMGGGAAMGAGPSLTAAPALALAPPAPAAAPAPAPAPVPVPVSEPAPMEMGSMGSLD